MWVEHVLIKYLMCMNRYYVCLHTRRGRESMYKMITELIQDSSVKREREIGLYSWYGCIFLLFGRRAVWIESIQVMHPCLFRSCLGAEDLFGWHLNWKEQSKRNGQIAKLITKGAYCWL